MILSVVQLLVRPEVADSFPFLVREFTEKTRNHPGNLWCDWSRNVDNPDEFTLIEAFADSESAIAHATSDYFVETMRNLPRYLVEPPRAINTDLPAEGWVQLADLPFFAKQPSPALARFS